MARCRLNISCILLCFAVLAVSCAGKRVDTHRTYYYVNANGNDAKNNGLSEKAPFKTLHRAFDAISKDKKPSIIVIVGELTAVTEEPPSTSESIFHIANSGKTEIIISGLDANAKLSAVGDSKRVIAIDGTSKIRFENITITGGVSVRGGGLLIADGAEATLGNGVTIQGNEARHGGGVLLSAGTLTVDGGVISANRAENGRGGGLSVDGSGTVIFREGKISGNQAQSGGGVAIVGSNRTIAFDMTGGEISANTASTLDGGGMLLSGGTLTMSGGVISDNITENGRGGGVAINDDGVFVLENGSIADNKSQSGGGVFFSGTQGVQSVLEIKGGTIAGNRADIRGGGVATSGGRFVMHGGEIKENISSGTGGGVSLTDCLFNMDAGSISGNQAQSGGGIFLTSPGASEMTDGTITNNSAIDIGGGVVVMRGTFTMSGGTMSGNTAQFGGGVAVSPEGVFSKTRGIIYGRDSISSANKANNAGNATYKDGGAKHFRNTTIEADELLSSLNEAGWE